VGSPSGEKLLTVKGHERGAEIVLERGDVFEYKVNCRGSVFTCKDLAGVTILGKFLKLPRPREIWFQE
jgi:hypothetical protein